MSNIELLCKLSDNLSNYEHSVKDLLDKAQSDGLDDKIYEVLYDFGARIKNAIETNNDIFLEQLGQK